MQTALQTGRSHTSLLAPTFRGVMKGIASAGLLYTLTAAPAMAVGFGEITRHSALGQPFVADVKLIGVNSDADLRCFKVNLTSLDGDRLGTVTFNVTDGDGGGPRLYVGTRENIGEPAVQVSVEYTCATTTRRDYQILLDPDTGRTPLTVNPPSVPAGSRTTPPVVIGKAPAAVSSASAGDVSAKKTRHHRDPSATPATAPASGATEIAAVPQGTGLKSSAALDKLDKKRARHQAKVFRNVLRLGDDSAIDDNLNGAESLHLSVSHGLNGQNSDLDVRNAPVNVPAAPAADGAPGAAAVASAPDTSAQLKDLQNKITKLETQTEELKKLNAKQVADLEAARKEKEAQGNQLYLYFLLLACIVAIGWLAWRSRQIQAAANHSWEDVLPEDKAADENPSVYHTRADDDLFNDPPRARPRPAVKVDAKPVVSTTEVDYPLDALDDVLGAQAPAPAPAPRKDDFLATLTMQRAGEQESGEGEYKFAGNVRQSLPDAEEILDEIQQAEFWMDMQQPQRAIEILESNWGTERPSSPLPWLYLFDLYRMVDDEEKYLDLTERFEKIFNGRVIPWEEKELLQHQRNLEDFPVLLKKITQLWRSDEIVPFMENLLIDDRDGRRQGFDLTAYRDILFLANIAYEIRESDGPATTASEIDAPDWSVLNH